MAALAIPALIQAAGMAYSAHEQKKAASSQKKDALLANKRAKKAKLDEQNLLKAEQRDVATSGYGSTLGSATQTLGG